MLAISTVLVLAAMVIVLSIVIHVNTRHERMVDAVMQVQTEIMAAHLWFEEVIAEDKAEDIAIVWSSIDNARWYIHAMLEGGSNQRGEYLPIKDPKMRVDVKHILQDLETLRRIARERWDKKEIAGIGSELDQKFDSIFRELRGHINEFEGSLGELIRSDQQTFRGLQISLIAFVLSLSIITGLVFRRNFTALQRREQELRAANQELDASNQQLMATEQQLRASNQQLEANNQQLIAGEQQLRASNQQLSATEQQLRASNQQLRASEERMRLNIREMPIAYVMWDTQWKTLEWNKAAEDIFGYTRDEIIGKNILEYIVPEEARPFVASLMDNFKKGDSVHYSETDNNIRKDGTLISCRWHNTPLLDEEGKIFAVLSMAEDITEKRKAEEALLEYQDRLRLLNSALSLAEEHERERIVGLLHDDVCQILGLIMMKLHQLRSFDLKPEIVEGVSESCGMLKQAIQATRTLMSDIRPQLLYDLGLEAALDELLANLVKMQKNIEPTFEDDGQSKPLKNSVRTLLYQAVRELLMNIVKHAQASKARVSIRREDNKISIVVEDDGVGFNVSETIDNLSTGEGFGLFSIRERMKNLGGNIEIESDPHKGTRITLLAPLSE